MKILHIANDEKFINAANWSFEQALPNNNTFFVLLNEKEPVYVNHEKNVIFLQNNKTTFLKVLNDVYNYDYVVLHGLYEFQSRLVLEAWEQVKFIWILFGGEIYDNPYLFGKTIYGEKTFKRFFNPYSYTFKNLLRPLYYPLKHQKKDRNLIIKEAAKKIFALGILHQEDFNLFFKKKIITDKIIRLNFTYYPIEFIFKNNEKITVKGNNILLGNSAAYTNNHLEAFDILKTFDINNTQIIVPLSYGNEIYARTIIDEGKKAFGKNFKPLLDFMTLEEYNHTISTCGISVFNNYRQQAVGNTLAMLWMGSKVYLDERNTFYHYLKRIGCIVFSINKELKPENKNALKHITNTEKEKNRSILLKYIGKERIIKNIKEFFYQNSH